MTQLALQRTVNASAPRVWEVLADFGGIYRFHPRVERSPLLNQKVGLGAERECHFVDGNSIKERIVDWKEGRSMTVDIFEGTMPLSCGRATLEVEALDSGRTRVSMRMGYEPKYGPLGKAMDMLMMKRQFRSVLESVLAGLDAHLRTGAVIGVNGEPTTAATSSVPATS